MQGQVRPLNAVVAVFALTGKSKVSFFDVPLHHHFHQASQAGANYDLRAILNDTVVQKRPGDAVTFVDNHE